MSLLRMLKGFLSKHVLIEKFVFEDEFVKILMKEVQAAGGTMDRTTAIFTWLHAVHIARIKRVNDILGIFRQKVREKEGVMPQHPNTTKGQEEILNNAYAKFGVRSDFILQKLLPIFLEESRKKNENEEEGQSPQFLFPLVIAYTKVRRRSEDEEHAIKRFRKLCAKGKISIDARNPRPKPKQRDLL